MSLSNAKTVACKPQIGFNCKKVLSTNLIYVHYVLKPLFTGKQQTPKNYEPGNSTVLLWASSGLLLKVQKLASHYSPSCHTATLCTEQGRRLLDITALPNLFAAFAWKPESHWQEWTQAWDILSLNWTMLLCLASWRLLSSTGAWLFTQRDGAKGNELDRCWRTEHSTCFAVIIAGKKAAEASR